MEVRAQVEVERLLREANIFRMRGNLEQAEEKCQAALALAPEDPATLEMQADLLRDRDRLAEAAEQYRLALEKAPGRAVLEKKYAEVKLELSERQRLRDLAQLALDHPELLRNPKERPRGKFAVLLSLFWPGAGHFYLAEGFDTKGAVLAVLALLCLPGLPDLVPMLLGFMGLGRVSGAGPLAFLGFMHLAIWIYALCDTLVQAQSASSAANDRLGF